jgi:protein-tyrosine phosphatase
VASVLFVCTGNIFRSLSAEYALRAALPDNAGLHVSSAGTADFPYEVRANVREYLLANGFDVAQHRRRTLTADILRGSDVVIAMSTDHQAHIDREYGLRAKLFLEACGEAAAALPDIEEVVLDYRTNQAAVDAHVRSTIDTIIRLAPALARRLLRAR